MDNQRLWRVVLDNCAEHQILFTRYDDASVARASEIVDASSACRVLPSRIRTLLRTRPEDVGLGRPGVGSAREPEDPRCRRQGDQGGLFADWVRRQGRPQNTFAEQPADGVSILLGQACRVRLERTCCSDHGDKRNENKAATNLFQIHQTVISGKVDISHCFLECGRQQTQPSLPELEIGSRHRFLDSDRSQGLRPLATLRLPIA
jgi:hypothetical protein